MSSMAENEPVHTFLDDIKYQTVKANNKRTSFVSSDHQITAKSEYALKAIQKSQKLATAEFRRQEAALVNRLEKLKETQQKLGTKSGFSGWHGRRRNSAPVTSLSPDIINECSHRASFSSPRPAPHENDINTTHEGHTHNGQQEEEAEDENTDVFQRSTTEILQSDFASRPVSLRRLSHEIQEATTKMAKEKFEIIMSKGLRRATIAAGATPSHILPPQGVPEGLGQRTGSMD